MGATVTAWKQAMRAELGAASMFKVGFLGAVDKHVDSLASRLLGTGLQFKAAEKLAKLIVSAVGEIVAVNEAARTADVFFLEAGQVTVPMASLVPLGAVPRRGQKSKHDRKRHHQNYKASLKRRKAAAAQAAAAARLPC